MLALLGTAHLGGVESLRSAWGHRVAAESSPEVEDGSEVLDEALEMLAPYGATYRGGLSNHGPMAAEALVTLGRSDAVLDWVDRYRKRLEARPAPVGRVDPVGWQASLGNPSSVPEWEAWFSEELRRAPWRAVLTTWLPRLVPGVAAAAFHGVIRTGHAVCALERSETEPRVDELARALAYWAAEYMPLPGSWSGKGALAPGAAFERVPLLPDERRRGAGLISTELAALSDFEAFAPVIDLVDPETGAPTFLDELLASLAGIYIHSTSDSFAFLHSVTGTAAIAELVPYVDPKDREPVLAYVWQASAGILSRYGHPGLMAEVESTHELKDFEGLVPRAVASGDEHTIKLTAACLRAWTRSPDERFLTAAAERAL